MSRSRPTKGTRGSVATTDDAVRAIQHEIAAFEKGWRKCAVGYGVAFVLVCLCTWLTFETGHPSIAGSLLAPTYIVALGLSSASIMRRRARLARALRDAGDAGALDVLVEAAHFQNGRLKTMAGKELARLVFSLSPSAVEHMSQESRDALFDLLRPALATDHRLVTAILRVLESVGDGSMVGAVRDVWLRTNGLLAGPYFDDVPFEKRLAAQAKLHAAAERCLRILEARAASERERDTLLRPASAPDDAASVLLRPAGAGPETPAERLLRPAEAEDETLGNVTQ